MATEEKPEIGATADANGIKTNYLEAGQGDAVIPVHGSGPGVTAYSNWRLVIPALAEYFRVLAPDMVGFGYTERPEGIRYGVQTWADQVIGLMDTLGVPRAHLIGNSFGGAIGLRIATQHPDRVGKLVLMGSMGVSFPITEGLDRVWGYEPSLPHRALIIHGREDKVIPVQTSLRLMELIDNGDLAVYSHCGHWSMIERNRDFNRAVHEFLTD